MSANSRAMNILQFPKINTLIQLMNHEEWSVNYIDDYRPLLLDEKGQLDSEIHLQLETYVNYANNQNYDVHPFRCQVSLKTIPVIVAFFFTEKKINIFSLYLGRELFIIKEINNYQQKTKAKSLDSNEEFQKFKTEVENSASLPTHQFPSVLERITAIYQLPDFVNNPELQKLNHQTATLVEKLNKHIKEYAPSFMERISDFGLNLIAQYAILRVHLLKFLAILPTLDHDFKGAEIKRTFREALQRVGEDCREAKRKNWCGEKSPLPPFYLMMTNLTLILSPMIPAKILSYWIKNSVKVFAKRFIAGITIENAVESLRSLRQSGRDATLDQLGELVVSEKEADYYCRGVLNLIDGLSEQIPPGELNNASLLKASVSIKVSALCSDFKPHAFDYTYSRMAPRLQKILLKGKEKKVLVNIDAEHYHYRDTVFEVYKKVLEQTPELADYKDTGIVIQAYLKDGHRHLQEILKFVKERNMPMPIRLVKGAYWDAETIEAKVHCHDAPEFLNKEETDLHFRQLMYLILQNSDHLQLCIASHNFADHVFSEVLREEKFPNAPIIEHQCLHMTCEPLSQGLVKMGWVVRDYVPIGNLLMGMGYLVRRIMENSSQVGFLTALRTQKEMKEVIPPQVKFKHKKAEGRFVFDQGEINLSAEFSNVTPVRLYLKKERQHFFQSLKTFGNSLGQFYYNPFINNGNRKQIMDPSNPKQVVGEINFASGADVDRAIDTANASYLSGKWSQCLPIERSSVLLKASQLMLLERLQLAALICYEGGKYLTEALADVDEAIDFLSYYAREEVRITKEQRTLTSRGIVVVIPPWNFPLAIPTGMTAGALVAGNSVILKPSQQTPLIAQKLVDILHHAGVPEDVLIHLPGEGRFVGVKLAKDPQIAGIVFTGSKEVGMWLYHQGFKHWTTNKLYEFHSTRKVVTEMGGKNAVIITSNAELDESVAGCLYSTFGHAGQKCSALSRIIVHDSNKKRFIERFKEAVGDIQVGVAYDPSTYINPVINKTEKDRLIKEAREAIEEAKNLGGVVHLDKSTEELPGQCVGPVIIELPYKEALHQSVFMKKELFGPIVHIVGYNDFDEAIDLFNATEYALTGGIFAQSQDDLDYFKEKAEAGNLYFNRGITGARVAVEPFGGFKLSGTGPKAGGSSYVKTFHLDPYYERDQDGLLDYQEGHDKNISFLYLRTKTFRDVWEAFNEGMNELFQNYEILFGGLYKDEKQIIKNFHSWLKSNLKDYVEADHPNRYIPGQINVNSFRLTKKQGIVIVSCEKPHLKVLLYILSALSLGVFLTILARNQKAYDKWTAISKFFNKFNNKLFSLYYPSNEAFKKAIKDNENYFIVSDENLVTIHSYAGDIYNEKFDELFMRPILTKYDAPHPNDFSQYLEEFICIRSAAINTMRHGAPLSLNA